MVMVMVMYKKGHVMSLTYPMTSEDLQCMGFVFVDDTDLIAIGDKNDSVQEVCIKQQQGMLCWEKILEITGGSLKPSKCYWYLVDFFWRHGEWFYSPMGNQTCRIVGDNGVGYLIRSLPVEESKEIMGVWQNLAGDNTSQIEALISKHSLLMQRFRTSYLSRRVVWRGFLGVLWSSIRYSFSPYAITVLESNKKISKLFRPLFNPMGIHRTFPSDVATLPAYYLGLGLPHSYI